MNPTTSLDPVIQELSGDMPGKVVFATDNILSTLMCAPRSLYSWDIVIEKRHGKMYLDKREGPNSKFGNLKKYCHKVEFNIYISFMIRLYYC